MLHFKLRWAKFCCNFIVMNCLLYYCIYFEYFSEFCNFEDFILLSMQIKFILMKKICPCLFFWNHLLNVNPTLPVSFFGYRYNTWKLKLMVQPNNQLLLNIILDKTYPQPTIVNTHKSTIHCNNWIKCAKLNKMFTETTSSGILY
jgi:hypothetical protein